MTIYGSPRHLAASFTASAVYEEAITVRPATCKTHSCVGPVHRAHFKDLALPTSSSLALLAHSLHLEKPSGGDHWLLGVVDHDLSQSGSGASRHALATFKLLIRRRGAYAV